MISEVTVIIEHGDTTDPLDEFLDAAGISENYRDDRVLDYTVKVDVPDPLGDALKSLSWAERAKVDSGIPLYRATHMSNHDDSDAMLVSTDEDGLILNLMNEDGFTWSDRAKDWRAI